VTHGLDPQILMPGTGRRFPGAGGDEITLRLASGGPDPITVIEDQSEDTEPAPLHSHPWDELVYVLEGEVSFTAGDLTAQGGPGTLQVLPRGVAHTLRVVRPPARFLMITVGAPAAEFLEEIGQVYAEGPTTERLIEVARRHGVQPHFEYNS
jgi:mannose-6-phosphate isomerase-like protein (cupin superfamily)